MTPRATGRLVGVVRQPPGLLYHGRAVPGQASRLIYDSSKRNLNCSFCYLDRLVVSPLLQQGCVMYFATSKCQWLSILIND